MADNDIVVDTPNAPAAPEPAKVSATQKLSWEQWAAKKKVPHWQAEAARQGRAWPMGQEVTEDEFNQAVYDAFNTRID